jgi:hypothetical protein
MRWTNLLSGTLSGTLIVSMLQYDSVLEQLVMVQYYTYCSYISLFSVCLLFQL